MFHFSGKTIINAVWVNMDFQEEGRGALTRLLIFFLHIMSIEDKSYGSGKGYGKSKGWGKSSYNDYSSRWAELGEAPAEEEAVTRA